MTARARVFSKDGNRFLIPGYWCDEDDENWDGMSVSQILCDGMMLGIACGFDSKQEWLDLTTDGDGSVGVRHLRYELVGPQFMHGAITVLLIGGPLFDAAVSAEDQP